MLGEDDQDQDQDQHYLINNVKKNNTWFPIGA